ncbi:MAG TPA: hypothetical protein PKO09_14440 [Anaerolineae bacterium]|nr:hypothetical protein [Anaerolineae bacterium]
MMRVTSTPCSSAAFARLSAETLGAGVLLRLRARGTSMCPLVRDGDILLARPLRDGLSRVRDIALSRIDEDRA